MRGSDQATVQADESRLAEAARVFAAIARSVGASEREMLQAIRNANN